MFIRLLKRCLPFALALLFTCSAMADEVAVPPLVHQVTDLTGTLTAAQQAALESKLAQFEQEKGSQIALLMVPTTQPETIEQYSIRVVDVWKLGRKKVDDGILILIAKDDRKMRIEVGYGLEGVIPDAVAKRVIAEVMTPHFKQGDFYGGINAAADTLIGLIGGEALPAPQRQAAGKGGWEGMLPLLLFGGIVVGGLLRAIFGSVLGGAATGGLVGAAIWIFGGGLLVALVLAIIAFFLTMSGGLGAMNMLGAGGFGRGGFGGGGGGFSGGGGGFGGGGASGSW